MGPQRIRTGLFAGTLALGLVLLLLVSLPRIGPLARAISAARGRPPAAAGGLQPAVATATPAGAEERSRLADGLNAPSGDVHSDLRLMNEVFVAYRAALRTGNPVGENSEITAALTGRNKLGYAFIAPDNPAINLKGELCDRWGTPYFFHQLSGEKMEIRSAGPDRMLWTADDEVLTP
jgi:hypothetical protein